MSNQMYPWVDETRNFIGGRCPHNCSYCYVPKLKSQIARKRYLPMTLFLIEKEFKKPMGSGKTIFIQSCGDSFANGVPDEWIDRILEFCGRYDNTYLFQTKNPERFWQFMNKFPKKSILGTTIETNKDFKISTAPKPIERYKAMLMLDKQFETMVSIEPIMDFDVVELVSWIRQIHPKFVSIGADSKKSNLTEPNKEKIEFLLMELDKFTEVKIKENLKRLMI